MGLFGKIRNILHEEEKQEELTLQKALERFRESAEKDKEAVINSVFIISTNSEFCSIFIYLLINIA